MKQVAKNTKELPALAAVNARLREKMQFWMPDEGEYGSILLHGFTATKCEHIGPCAVVGEPAAWPAIELVVQGNKCVETDGSQHHFAAYDCFISGIGDMETSRVTTASADTPYLSISLRLDHGLLGSLIEASGLSLPLAGCGRSARGAQADVEILDAFLRLINLIADPEYFFCLAPLVSKEIHYRMLIGPLGGSMCRYYLRHEFGRVFE